MNLSALAYLATRLPATYAAIRTSLAAVVERRPDFAPRSLLDVGAGPGDAICGPRPIAGHHRHALLIEHSPAIRRWGERLAADAPVKRIAWRNDDLGRLPDLAPCDLAMLAYVLGELAPERQTALIEKLWARTAGLLLIVEPGTPAGWTADSCGACTSCSPPARISWRRVRMRWPVR